MCEVGAVRRGIKFVRRWGLNFSMSGDEGRDNAHRVTTRGFVNSRILLSLSSSVQFVGLILPSNSHAEITTRLYASAIFPISGDWDVLLPLIWNGLCDRRRAEITVMQFTGHSLPEHQPSTPAHSLSIIGHWDVSHPLSSELQVWSSSSGNNYHAVHRSVSSGASLFLRHSENFYLVSYCEPSCILHKEPHLPDCLPIPERREKLMPFTKKLVWKWKTNSFILDLNLAPQVHFLRWYL